MTKFIIIIPARMDSTRLPRKPMIDICGKPLIQRTWEAAKMSSADRVIIATDDNEILDLMKSIGAEVILTDKNHASGTDRIAEAAKLLDLDENQIIVNVQGDEPTINPSLIDHLASLIEGNKEAQIVTACRESNDIDDYYSNSVVKVVLDRRKYALYFSRSPIPFRDINSNNGKEICHFNHHIGIYAYKNSNLQRYIKLSDNIIENIEKLEQLRVIWNEGKILVHITDLNIGHGVDTPEDLKRVIPLFN